LVYANIKPHPTLKIIIVFQTTIKLKNAEYNIQNPAANVNRFAADDPLALTGTIV
jgi:hypothetical protein